MQCPSFGRVPVELRNLKSGFTKFIHESCWENKKFLSDLTFGHFGFFDHLCKFAEVPDSQISTPRDRRTLWETKSRLWQQDMYYGCRKIESRMHHGPSICQTRTSAKYRICRDLCKIREVTNMSCSNLKTQNSPTRVFFQLGTDPKVTNLPGFLTKLPRSHLASSRVGPVNPLFCRDLCKLHNQNHHIRKKTKFTKKFVKKSKIYAYA